MIKSNFLKEVHTGATILQNFNAFRAKLEPLKKTDILTFLKKSTSQSISILAIVSHPHFLMGSIHLSSAAYKINHYCLAAKNRFFFSRFPNHAKNSGSVPLIPPTIEALFLR